LRHGFSQNKLDLAEAFAENSCISCAEIVKTSTSTSPLKLFRSMLLQSNPYRDLREYFKGQLTAEPAQSKFQQVNQKKMCVYDDILI
jgi:hypothetical protein